jgi:excisionase family DNA binding protein
MSDAPEPERRFFTIAKVAMQLDVCTKTVRNWIDRGELRRHKVGRQIRIAEADLLLFLDERRK